MKKLHSILTFLLLAAMLIPVPIPEYDVRAQGDLIEVEIQPDAASMKDAKFASHSPNTNYGTDTTLSVGEQNNDASVQRSVLEFDLSGLPADLTVVSATLTLTVNADFSDNVRTMRAYPLIEEWT